jgi:hypothetical protein
MVYVCESACFTAVDLARDDIAVDDGFISLFYNGKVRSGTMFKASRLAYSSSVRLEPRHSATARDYYTILLYVSRHQGNYIEM